MKIHKNMLKWPTWRCIWKFTRICSIGQLGSLNENSKKYARERKINLKAKIKIHTKKKKKKKNILGIQNEIDKDMLNYVTWKPK